MNIPEILLHKAQMNQLGHFYIVETSAKEETSFRELFSFVHNFIRTYYQKIENHKQSLENLMDHPDVFVLGKVPASEEDESEKAFTVSDAELLSRFFEFKAVQSKRKFAVITEGHRISSLVANKWLKLFEEPQGNSTIFLLNPRGQKLLETIHSRAIHLRLPATSLPQDFSEWNTLLKDAAELSLSQFLETYSRKTSLTYWVGELIRWESEQLHSSPDKSSLKDWIVNFEEMETFNQPVATKWVLFHSYLVEHVLPRQNH